MTDDAWRTDPRERLLAAIDQTWAYGELATTPEQLVDDYAHHLAEQSAVLAQVRALYEQWVTAGPPPLGASMARWWDSRLAELRAALQQDGEQPAHSGHRYLSTGCLHGDHTLPDGRTGHQYCQSATGKTGGKQPAQCKFCAAPCVCGCHNQPAPAVPAAPAPVDWRRVLDGFESLLKAFPADLHPGGPAVTCRPQPAGLVARWRDTVRTARQQTADQTTERGRGE